MRDAASAVSGVMMKRALRKWIYKRNIFKDTSRFESGGQRKG